MDQAETERRVRERAASAKSEAEASLDNAQGGRKLEVGDSPVPVRSVAALSIFVAAFVVAYLLTWTILGGIGLAIGVITGLIAGALAAKVYADRAASAR